MLNTNPPEKLKDEENTFSSLFRFFLSFLRPDVWIFKPPLWTPSHHWKGVHQLSWSLYPAPCFQHCLPHHLPLQPLVYGKWVAILHISSTKGSQSWEQLCSVLLKWHTVTEIIIYSLAKEVSKSTWSWPRLLSPLLLMLYMPLAVHSLSSFRSSGTKTWLSI